MERSDLDFIRDTLVTALNEKRDGIIGDLFKLYEEVQNRPTIPAGNINIDKILGDMGTEYNFSLSSDYMPQAAGDVVVGGFSNDVISFGDYQSRED
ncbi:hypothetical protein [Synechococcus phage S-H9-2]|jgi:hypothetical protein|uniref:Uncharacterized protein n=1 Tax=Synechococcus phage S-H9-2 TaxID=2783669 RepID=A0A873WJZ9_9CAUD|nr:hypothetical protein PQC10_gp195 [Synechococcus phage S-H9-2]QPB08395.1 hypothetical protein [Synechococcus phage S-H9-2]